MAYKLLLFTMIALLLGGCETSPKIDFATGCDDILPYKIENIGDNLIRVKNVWKALYEHSESNASNKLVVFMDGTDNDAYSLTNIRILYLLAVDHACDNPNVIPYYAHGVGATKTGTVFGGGPFGTAFWLQIFWPYAFLVETYKEGDEIFIFGFSRGAFAARSLNGLLSTVGLLDKTKLKKNGTGNVDSKDLRMKAIKAFQCYISDGSDRGCNNISKNDFVDAGVKVKAIGVFDTVSALYLPNKGNQEEDHKVDLYADYGFHAMSIDEIRGDFRLVRFNKPPTNETSVLEEVWFAGVHSNVGGGYDKQASCSCSTNNNIVYEEGLEAIPLNWMINKFFEFDIFPDIEPFKECPCGKLHDEYYDSWWLKYAFRTKPKKPRKLRDGDLIHESVLKRMECSKLFPPHPERETNGCYFPCNVNLGGRQNEYYQHVDIGSNCGDILINRD